MPVRKNSHKYKNDEKYLHFFKRPQAMQMIKYLYKNIEGNFYFCTFNIPITQLILHHGQGYYPTSGYEEDVHTESEFAIHVDKFNPDWLTEYTLDTERQNISLGEAIERTK